MSVILAQHDNDQRNVDRLGELLDFLLPMSTRLFSDGDP